ncbi:hypothetical protein C8R45DRAFT_1113690 [Mycena sanguinolenta]|nr:hypothetical protein C8R45DRAFT_1113690 [Mycena sanguinolenta]
MDDTVMSATPPGTPPMRSFSVPPPDPMPAIQPALPSQNLSPGSSNALDGVPEPPATVKSDKGKVKAPRHKKGEEKQIPGRESWVHGTKLKFFAARKAEYLEAAEQSSAGDKTAITLFYTKISRLYFIKYGTEMEDDEDLAVDVDDPPDEAANEVVNEKTRDSDVENTQAKLFKFVRTRIGEWYRRKYGGLLKSDKAAFKELFAGVLDYAQPKPQRGQLRHFYSRRYFDSRVKLRYEERMAALKRRAGHTGEKVPAPLALQNQVTKEVWDDETPAFQEEVKVAWEREYQTVLKAWQASLSDGPARTPEEFAATLENGAHYLQPFIDAVSERFGMCASLMLCGPIGKRGGAVGIQSVHSGFSKGLVPMKWPQWDKVGYAEAESRMLEFGKNCFSEAECRARAVGSAMSSGSNPTRGATPAVPSGGTPPAMARTTSTDAFDGGSGSGGAHDEGAGGHDEGGAGRAVPDGGATTGGVDDHAGEGGSDAGASGGGEDETDRVRILQGRIDELWSRGDRRRWTKELGHAHAAFERGRGWGIEWARCVAAFFDFEAAHGYTDGTRQLDVDSRPGLVYEWIVRKRDWTREMIVGFLDGPGRWVEQWWTWWVSMQPSERTYANGTLDRPDGADWGELAAMNGKSGLLLVMASLLWWGDRAGGDAMDADVYQGWTKAVEDVTWTLEALKESGCIVIERSEEAGDKRKRGRPARADGEEGEGPKKVRRSMRGATSVAERSERTTRASAAQKKKAGGKRGGRGQKA